uniref:Uncharacterized protein n=1 Tax=Tanacetum cinerariifolium TaxID=118510 RepID=A0A699QCE7_TANCI|nr:hypothetical protein [Tanacetum cinerariifolium]
MPIELPYQGRAAWQDLGSEVQISIPARRNWLVLTFMLFWLCGWLVGEVVVLGFVTGSAFGALSDNRGNEPPVVFLLAWLTFWTTAGLFIVRIVWWQLGGYELVTVGNGLLTIAKLGLLFNRPKTYDLSAVRHLRAQEDPLAAAFGGFATYRSFGGFGDTGSLRFDYGLKTVKFGAGLDEAEARHLIQRLHEQRILTEQNLT